jgi:mscS mechanosensitive ion channel
MRIELLRLVKTTDLWDGRTVALQVMDATGGSVRVRAVVSATNSSRLFELRCLLREQLINWLQTQAVYALPRTRLEPDTTTAPPQEQRQDFVEQVKADWEAEQANEQETQLLPPTESSEHNNDDKNQQHSGGRLGWLKAFRRSIG